MSSVSNLGSSKRDFKGHIHEDAVFPVIVEFRAEQKYSVHEQDRGACRSFDRYRGWGILVEVKCYASILVLHSTSFQAWSSIRCSTNPCFP